ncbi:hypothetical protein H6A35_02305 [Collinsella tanakaei]|nr:hypothetical protein [Collinsella tanakaei]
MALAMLESCGSYALFDPSPLAEIVQKELLSHQVISAHMANGDHRIREFYDASGKRTPFVDDEGDELSWQAVFSPRSDTVTDMWRRPPLTSRMELQELEAKLGRIWGSAAARAAVPMVLDGSASPLESRCAALLFSPVACGDEGWEAPYLNRRIDWSSQAAKLVDTSYCIADALWPDKNSILEINGEEYHTDADGFKTASGRTPALESMGYRVVEITHAQLSDLEQLDQMFTVISRRLDLPLCERTTIWLKRRSTLHEGLFSQCSY